MGRPPAPGTGSKAPNRGRHLPSRSQPARKCFFGSARMQSRNAKESVEIGLYSIEMAGVEFPASTVGADDTFSHGDCGREDRDLTYISSRQYVRQMRPTTQWLQENQRRQRAEGEADERAVEGGGEAVTNVQACVCAKPCESHGEVGVDENELAENVPLSFRSSPKCSPRGASASGRECNRQTSMQCRRGAPRRRRRRRRGRREWLRSLSLARVKKKRRGKMKPSEPSEACLNIFLLAIRPSLGGTPTIGREEKSISRAISDSLSLEQRGKGSFP